MWDNKIHITIHKTNKDLLYSTQNYGHSQWLSGKESACNAGDTEVVSLVWEDPLEKKMATHSNILAWRIPWTEEPGELQSMGSQRIAHD